MVLAALAAGLLVGAVADRPAVAGAAWPTDEEAQRYYPPEALAAEVGGRAVVACAVVDGALSHCRAVEEAPAGYGFGAAAVQLISRLRVAPEAAGRLKGAAVQMPVSFGPHGPQSAPLNLWRLEGARVTLRGAPAR